MPSAYQVPLDQIQGNVTPGFRKDFEDFLFLSFPAEALRPSPDLTRVRGWLREVQPSIASAREVATFNALYLLHKKRIGDAGAQEHVRRFLRSTWVNVAFSAIGHAALRSGDVGPANRQSAAFVAGMFNRENDTKDYIEELDASTVRDSVRAAELHPEVVEAQQRQVAHALIVIGANSEPELDRELAKQLEIAATYGLARVERFRGATLGGGREHFGFRDGISQPDPGDVLDPRGWITGDNVVAPGELVRGLPAEPGHRVREPLDWERNGSYLVFRRLEQNVQAFRDAAQQAAEELRNGDAPDMTAAWFEAKCVGRWPDGTPVDRAPIDPAYAAQETSEQTRRRLTVTARDYADDPEGALIPRYAHIRKVHPRDREEAQPRHHRLVRRGIPYGPVLTTTPGGDSNASEERGLNFVAYMASIEDQFEHLMRFWVNATAFPSVPSGADAGHDPIVGGPENDVAGDRVLYHATPTTAAPTPVRQQGISFARFVTFKGGGYFFAPSIAHIAELAGAQQRAPALGRASMQPAATFLDLAYYILEENPYSLNPQLPLTLGDNGGPGVLTVDAGPTDPWQLHWDFREPAAGTVDGHPFEKWDVVNYRIARAVVVPTSYAWVNDPPADGSMRTLYANLLIGYTPPRASIAKLELLPFVDKPEGDGTGQGYLHLAEIIERRFPLSGQPRLRSRKIGQGDVTDVVKAVSFLMNRSKRTGEIFQRNNGRLTLEQRQQCLYWDGPKRIGSERFPPSADSRVAPPSDPYRVDNYQITKAFRIGYTYTEGGITYDGDILIGFNGAGDG